MIPTATQTSFAVNGWDRMRQRSLDVTAFVLPALALAVPSGYSYGASLLLLTALLSLRCVAVWPTAPQGRWLLLALTLMGGLLCLDIDHQMPRTLEMPLKYAAALCCVGLVSVFRPSVQAWSVGVMAGAAASGAIALFQTLVLHKQRAGGFTNEIQYGNLSLLLGLLAGVVLFLQGRSWPRWQRVSGGLAVLLGLLGSLLSQSRGGWLALLWLVPVGLWLFRQHRPGLRSWAAMGLGCVLLLACVWPFKAALTERLGHAVEEVQAYRSHGVADTSVGQRLAHWRLAWEMGADRPWLGWGGQAGYNVEKLNRVASGAHPESLLNFTHAHNEWLDQFAKRGMLGVSVLALFYIIPLAIFWPTRRRAMATPVGLRVDTVTVRWCGVLVVTSYVGFGMTQVFFSHNSGHMFYVFPLILLCGMLAPPKLEVPAPTSTAAAAAKR